MKINDHLKIPNSLTRCLGHWNTVNTRCPRIDGCARFRTIAADTMADVMETRISDNLCGTDDMNFSLFIPISGFPSWDDLKYPYEFLHTSPDETVSPIRKKYVVCPGRVVNKDDGQTRYVKADELIRLYGVNGQECAIYEPSPWWPDSYYRMAERQHSGLIRLYPRHNGDYSLSSSTHEKGIESFLYETIAKHKGVIEAALREKNGGTMND